MVSVVAAFLRTQNVRLAVYLDDWLVVNQSKTQLYQDRKKSLDLLISLGFLIIREKSSLLPTQKLVYLGGQFHLDKGLVCPTQERIDKLNMAVLILSSGNAVSAFHFLQLLGIMASCIELIPNARLFMRPNQLHLLSFWRPSCQDLSIKIPVILHLKSHLRWWKNSANTQRGQFFQLAQTSVTITTDASKSGYGGFINNQIFQVGMVRNTEQEAYKFPRIGSSVFNAETLPKSVERSISICSDKIGQYHSGSIYKQTRGDEITHSLLPNMGFMESCNSKQYSVEGCSYNRKIEHFSRPTQSNHCSTYRMVSEQTYSSKSISN
ncbi:unnamed protein product [Mytilus coruscus]|uniref:Reverse transcriptase domain-containing protein n=1 Tax=Mytilus coruscus TaxID=42192 RepID=A0A6J8DT37_MYTCO|nr:unnamed protein product [Mytilus coruscus]